MALDGLLVFTIFLKVGVEELVVVVSKHTSEFDVLHEEGNLGEYVVELLLGDVSQGVGQGGVVKLATGALGGDDCVEGVRKGVLRKHMMLIMRRPTFTER